MARHRMIVFTDPVAGQEDAYNRWYNDEHLKDVTAVPGVASAQRFRVRTTIAGALANRYLAVYDLETDDPDAVIAEVFRRSDTSLMPLSPALDRQTFNVALVEACSEIVTSAD